MKFLESSEQQLAYEYLLEATKEAKLATCQRAKCGSIIVKDNLIIGRGFNSPPLNLENQRRCTFDKNSYDRKVTDKTCCIHAEQRAILDAVRNHPENIIGSRLYFIRIDEKGNMTFAGKPYCTVCSKLALESGIKEFVLYHENGICVYDTDEYNELSYQYRE